jgi:hypothetical protein
MQATTCFHDGIANPIFQQTDFVFHDPLAFHPTNGVFNTHSGGGNSTIGLLLRRGQFSARWGFLGLEDRDARQAKPLKALILIQATAGWQRIASQFGNGLISGFPFIGIAQEAHMTGLSDHEEVFKRVTLLLATVVFLLLFGIDRALNRTFGAIMPKRGVVELLSVSNMSANSAAVRAGSSSWLANA